MWPVRQCSQWPQKADRQVITWSPDLHRAHLRADLLDDAGALVAQHRRQRIGIGALDEVQVGVADAGGGGADQHLVRPGLADLHVLDLEAACATSRSTAAFMMRLPEPWNGGRRRRSA